MADSPVRASAQSAHDIAEQFMAEPGVSVPTWTQAWLVEVLLAAEARGRQQAEQNRPQAIPEPLPGRPEPMRRALSKLLDRLYGLHYRPGHLDALMDVINLHAPVKVSVDVQQAEQERHRRACECQEARADGPRVTEPLASTAGDDRPPSVSNRVAPNGRDSGHVHELQKALDESQLHDRVHYQTAGQLAEQNVAFQKQVSALTQALKDYAEHEHGCPRRGLIPGLPLDDEQPEPDPCTCGLDAALTGAQA